MFSKLQLKGCKTSTVPTAIGTISVRSLKGVHEHVQGLTSQVTAVQESLKVETRIETEGWGGE